MSIFRFMSKSCMRRFTILAAKLYFAARKYSKVAHREGRVLSILDAKKCDFILFVFPNRFLNVSTFCFLDQLIHIIQSKH